MRAIKKDNESLKGVLPNGNPPGELRIADAEKFLEERALSSLFNHFIEPDPDQILRVSVALGFSRGRLASVY